MKSFAGQVAVITGAASGIGRALAELLAIEGASLALCDIAESELAITAQRCQHLGATVIHSVVDVSNRSAVEAWAGEVAEHFGTVNLLFNNAGVALLCNVVDANIEDMEWLMSINYWGVVYGVMAFLPYLKASGDGHIVNVSSVFGLISIPSQAAYNSAKFAVRGFSDALRMELEIARQPVSVTTVHPGGIKTNIVHSARSVGDAQTMMDAERFHRIALTSPLQAARTILKGVKKNRRRLTIGVDAKVIDGISRLPAPVYQRVLVSGQRRRNLQSCRGL